MGFVQSAPRTAECAPLRYVPRVMKDFTTMEQPVNLAPMTASLVEVPTPVIDA